MSRESRIRPASARAMAIGLTLVVGSLAACSAPTNGSGVGVVTGLAPICYGPGPDENLEPRTTIRAERADGLTRTITVPTADGRNRYRMTLPAGRYRISAYSGHIRVEVTSDRVLRNADLPQPGCL